MEHVDVAIIGAGVVGLASAARLARPDRTVVVLDAQPRYGVETSSRNSEVVHAGLYYPPGSLKSRFCHEGRRLLYRLAPEAGVFIRKCGKYVVAGDAAETAELEAILKEATASGAQGLRLVDGADARDQVPGLRAEAALWSPETGILDSEDLMRWLYGRATDQGAIFLFKSPVTRAEPSKDGHILFFGGPGAAAPGGQLSSSPGGGGSTEETLKARVVVNSAGLHSDKVAAMAGIDVDKAGYRLHWCKGNYFRCRKSLPVDRLIYPVPSKHGLGIHMTIDRRGGVRFGPDTEFVDKLDYDVSPALAPKFHAAALSYWPNLALEDVFPDTSGIRPKLSGPSDGFRDFVVAEESARGLPGWIDLIGIESPGLTSSLAIAEEVSRLSGLEA